MHGIGQIGYNITWVFVCLSVSLCVCLSEIPIVHDSDRSFCPIFLRLEMQFTHLTTKTKLDGQ